MIFDWGGTLTPWHTVDLREQWRVYARAAAAGDVEQTALQLFAADEAAWESSRLRHLASGFPDVVAAAGLEEHPAGVAAYREYWEPHTHTDPEVPELFAALRERGLRVGVLSNTIWPRAWHEDVFTRDGVLDLIDGAVYTSEIVHTKPHAEAFRAAMNAVGVEDPARCVFVGDRPYDDISGAQAVGMRAVLVPHSEIPLNQQMPVDVTPDAVIQRIGEVLPIVDTWRFEV